MTNNEQFERRMRLVLEGIPSGCKLKGENRWPYYEIAKGRARGIARVSGVWDRRFYDAAIRRIVDHLGV